MFIIICSIMINTINAYILDIETSTDNDFSTSVEPDDNFQTIDIYSIVGIIFLFAVLTCMLFTIKYKRFSKFQPFITQV